jgi:hypothetical protein
MFQKMLLRKLLKDQLAGIPEAEQERIFNLIEKNPDLFKKIAEEAQQKMKNGKERFAAITETFKEHEAELSALNLSREVERP